MNVARQGRSRVPIERMKLVASLLRHGLPFTMKELTTHCEVGRKTIARDIAFMRDRLGYGIEFDCSRQLYQLRRAPTATL